jgi:hypothetical protein
MTEGNINHTFDYGLGLRKAMTETDIPERDAYTNIGYEFKYNNK